MSLPETTKTYPPEVAKAREEWLKVARRIQEDYVEKPLVNPTAIQMMRRPLTQEQLAEKGREYQQRMEPVVKALAELECFAKVTIIIPKKP